MAAEASRVLDPDELNNTDGKIVELLADGRVSPPYVAEELDISREYASERLIRLREHDHVIRIAPGLYELVDDPREATDTTPTTDAPGDIETLQTRIETLEESLDDYEATIGRLRAENEQLREAGGIDPADLRPIIVALEGAQDRNGIEDCVERLKELVGDD